MINPISINTNSQKSNKTNVAIIAGGTALGVVGGYGLFRKSGVLEKLNAMDNNCKKQLDEYVKNSIAELELKTFNEAKKNSSKYQNLWDEYLDYNKKFKKDFDLKDFLDSEDLKKVNDEITDLKKQLSDAICESTAQTKKITTQNILKFVGIGAAVGLGASAVVVMIKKYLENKNKV